MGCRVTLAGRGPGGRLRHLRARRSLLALMLLRWACCEHRAWADDPPKRPVPDYSNRGKPPVTPGDVGLASVRVVAAPAYFVTEYIIRRPLEVTIPALERSGVPKSLYDFFLFGPDHKAGIVPTFLADFGL